DASKGGFRLERPWILLILANGLALLGFIVAGLGIPLPAPVRVILLLAATILALIGVEKRLRTATWEWPSRVETAAVLSLAGLVAMGSYASLDRDWVSGHMFYGAAFIAAVSGSVLILLPSVARRFALSLVLLFHFAGMAVCVTSVDPPGNEGPWLAKQLFVW